MFCIVIPDISIYLLISLFQLIIQAVKSLENELLSCQQVPITVHFDHGNSKRELVEVLELVSQLSVLVDACTNGFGVKTIVYQTYVLSIFLSCQGFDSVMVDGSHLPFKDNISYTKFISFLAHSKSMMVEAELGRLSGTEDDLTIEHYEGKMTDVEQVFQFSYSAG